MRNIPFSSFYIIYRKWGRKMFTRIPAARATCDLMTRMNTAGGGRQIAVNCATNKFMMSCMCRKSSNRRRGSRVARHAFLIALNSQRRQMTQKCAVALLHLQPLAVRSKTNGTSRNEHTTSHRTFSFPLRLVSSLCFVSCAPSPLRTNVPQTENCANGCVGGSRGTLDGWMRSNATGLFGNLWEAFDV